MIRVLFVGREASPWAARLEDSSGVETVSARLPAAAIRSFEQSPPDVVVFVVSGPDRRLAGAVAAIRSRPLGAVTPLIAIGSSDEMGEEVSEAVDVWLDGSVEPDSLLETFAEELELDPAELAQPEFPTPRKTTGTGVKPLPADDVELDASAIERKLQAVRHESYFAVLEVEPQASAAVIRDAFETLRRRYAAERVPDGLRRRFGAELDEIRDALEDAWAVLGNETLRGRYAEAALSG